MSCDIGFQGHRSRCRWWYWPAIVASLEAQPQGHQAVPLRYPPRPRYASITFANRIQALTSFPQVSLPTLVTSTPRARYDATAKISHQHLTNSQKVTGHEATPSGLADALKGAEIVVIPAGVPRKPGMTRDGMEGMLSRRQTSTNITQTCSTPTPPSSAIWPRQPLSMLPMPTS
jgi:hypothetical protein